MNHYRLEDLSVGMSESFSVTVTPEMQESFRATTGDINPMHMDKDECTRGGTLIP